MKHIRHFRHGRIKDIHVMVGKVVCQMIFLVVDIDNYDILLGLDFLMQIGAIFGVEKGVI
jgi:hypothetical protein